MFYPEKILQKYCLPNINLYRLLLKHSQQVRDKALEVVKNHPEFAADTNFVSEAAMLHDIGIYLCNAPDIHCFGSHKYIEHGYLGAEILNSEGLSCHALVAERHTGTGISLQNIVEKNMPLPHRDMQPQTIEEQIICYADKFFSKSKPDHEFSVTEIVQKLARFSAEKKFLIWHEKFSIGI